MKKQIDRTIYGVYYRKSSEAEDRQAQSIPDQIRDTDSVIQKEQLVVGKKYQGESQTAFKIGRPIFADLVKDILDGKINAVLVWHPNRLARNPRDGGMLLWLIDEKLLKEIRTPSRVYRNTSSDKFMLQLEFGMSKKDSDDKSEVVKRALEGRAKRGLPNGVAHIGYTNDQTKEKGNRGWIRDSIRHPMIKKVLIMFLSGRYSVRELHIYARDELKLTTPMRKKQGGKPIALSYMYTLLKDPIHAGFFFQESSGEKIRYEFNAFEPMITEDDYWKIQDMLGTKGRPRMTKRKAVYNYFSKCGTCGGMLSHDFKFQVICSNKKCKKKFSYLNRDCCPVCDLLLEKMVKPTFLSYVFYYCINNKKHRTKCPGNGIEEKSLETQLIADIDQKLVISKELSVWCIDNIGKLKDEALDDAINLKKNLEQEKSAIQNKLKRLTDLRISRDCSPAENLQYDDLEKGLRQELSLLELKTADTNIDWMGEAIRDFNLMSEVLLIIKNGTIEQKIDLLFAFGSNLTISDKKVTVTNKKSIEAFKKCLLLARAENKSFEPKTTLANACKINTNNDKTEVFASVCPTLLRTVNSVRTIIQQQNKYIYIPDLRNYSNA